MSDDYKDIINLPHHVSSKRPQMPMLDRKQQILMERLGDHPALTVTYFVPDAKKSGGAYVTKSGNLKKIDEFERLMMLMDGTKIPLDNVADIESELFRDMF